MVLSHGFEDVVSGNGFLLEVQPGIFDSPTSVWIGRQMENLVNALEIRQHFWKIQKIEGVYLELWLAGVLGQMFPPAGGKIIQNPHFPGRGVGQQGIQQMRTDKTGSARDQIC